MLQHLTVFALAGLFAFAGPAADASARSGIHAWSHSKHHARYLNKGARKIGRTLEKLSRRGAFGDGNYSWTDQNGYGNVAISRQEGTNNVSGIAQLGRGNSATHEQTGSNNTAFTVQVGRDHTSHTRQVGDGNSSVVFQGGW